MSYTSNERVCAGPWGPREIPFADVRLHTVLSEDLMGGTSRATRDDLALEFGEILDRRDWQRQRAKDTRATISWNQDDGPHSQECRLVDIGGGGMAILMSRIPPRGRVLSLSLESLDKLSVDGRMVNAQLNHKPGMHLVRVKFIMECPPNLFERAIHGGEGSPNAAHG